MHTNQMINDDDDAMRKSNRNADDVLLSALRELFILGRLQTEKESKAVSYEIIKK